jgi:hypothetical protein
MASMAQLARLEARVDALALRLEPRRRARVAVWLSFDGESDDEFMARHPDARGPDGERRKADIVLNLGERE